MSIAIAMQGVSSCCPSKRSTRMPRVFSYLIPCRLSTASTSATWYSQAEGPHLLGQPIGRRSRRYPPRETPCNCSASHTPPPTLLSRKWSKTVELPTSSSDSCYRGRACAENCYIAFVETDRCTMPRKSRKSTHNPPTPSPSLLQWKQNLTTPRPAVALHPTDLDSLPLK